MQSPALDFYMCIIMGVSVGRGHEIRKGFVRGTRGLKDEGRGVQYTCMEVERGFLERQGSKKRCQRMEERSRKAGDTTPGM